MLFTCNDDPHSGKPALQVRMHFLYLKSTFVLFSLLFLVPQRQAAAKAEDLHQNGVNIELLHLSSSGKTFDVNKFYKDVLFPDEDENVELPDASEKLDELLTR